MEEIMEMSLVWVVAAVGLLLLEILTPGVFFFACLGVGALAASAVSAVGGSPTVEWAVFFAVSIASIYLVRPFARRYFGGLKKKSNVDAVVGRAAPLIEKVTPDSLGLVKIDGEFWKVSSQETLEAGQRIEVVAVEGTHLVVKKQ
ncbi:MAG: NfeD family protein [Elusimicrobia bacterium HGW-Elusimicrobia-1]|jgi:membrane protein implicated in regulation of membrane protease activity|nr:MAG: NfeD family protein [Elusimicrobia bacterium HGW-Elusimicrobia-1]